MNRLPRWTFLPLSALLSALLIAPVFAADDKKDEPKTPPKVVENKDEPKTPPKAAVNMDEPKTPPKVTVKKDDPKPVPSKIPNKKEAENKFIKAGEIAGEVTHVEPTKNSIRVKVTISYSEVNRDAYKGLIQAQIDLRNARDFTARNSALTAMAQHQRNLYSIKSVGKEIPVDAADECKVRMAQPKAAFDDMGNVRRLTAKELAALRGKDRLFDAEFSDLSVGQRVRVLLVKPKTAPAAPGTKEAIKLDDYKVQASRIVILTQPAPK